MVASAIVAIPAGARSPVVGFALAPPAEGVTLPFEDPTGDPVPTARESGQDQPDPPGIGYLTHAIYFVPQDKTDQALDATGGSLRRALDTLLAWFEGRMGKHPRMDRTTTGGPYDLTFVRGAGNAAEYAGIGDISAELEQRGFDQSVPPKRYIVFAAINRGSVCGEGYYPLPAGLDPAQYSIVYLDSATSCGTRDWGDGTVDGAGKNTTVTAHEWLHNDGIVPLGAPHHCVPLVWHVCTGPLAYAPGVDPEEKDVMFPFVTHRANQKGLDLHRDDYLDHGQPQTELRNSPWLEF